MATGMKMRGRPKGTGIDDSKSLLAMAEAIVNDPNLKPTTAYKQSNRKWDDKDIRRIQIKWRAEGELYLAEVYARRTLLRQSSVGRSALATETYSDTIERAMATMTGSLGSARAMSEVMNSPAMRMAQEIHNSPTARMAREIYDSPTARMAREIYDSPTARFAREFRESPSERVMRQILWSKRWFD